MIAAVDDLHTEEWPHAASPHDFGEMGLGLSSLSESAHIRAAHSCRRPQDPKYAVA